MTTINTTAAAAAKTTPPPMSSSGAMLFFFFFLDSPSSSSSATSSSSSSSSTSSTSSSSSSSRKRRPAPAAANLVGLPLRILSLSSSSSSPPATIVLPAGTRMVLSHSRQATFLPRMLSATLKTSSHDGQVILMDMRSLPKKIPWPNIQEGRGFCYVKQAQ